MTEPDDVPPGPPHDTETETHSEPRAVDDHASDEAGHGHDDHAADHGHADEPLGPLDVPRWGAAVGGVLIGIVVAACFAFSTGAL